MAVAEEDPGYSDWRKTANDGVEQGSRIRQRLGATVSAQDMSNNPDLLSNFCK